MMGKRRRVMPAIRSTKSKSARYPEKPQVVEAPQPCPICQEPVGVRNPDGVTEGWSTLLCGHRFGSVCIKRWLGMADRPGCPMCRQDVVHVCGHAILPAVDKTRPAAASSSTAATTFASKNSNRCGPRAWKRMSRDDPRKADCGFCELQPRTRPRLRARVLTALLRLVLRTTRQQQHIQSIANWERGMAVVRQQEVRRDWEDWWDIQEPRTARDRDVPLRFAEDARSAEEESTHTIFVAVREIERNNAAILEGQSWMEVAELRDGERSTI